MQATPDLRLCLRSDAAGLARLTRTVSFVTPMKRLRILLAATAVALCGCASIGGRGDSRFYPSVYPGVQNHIYYFAHREENDMPSLWWLGIIDFPFSAALDTALLPWDVPYWAFQPRACTNSASQ